MSAVILDMAIVIRKQGGKWEKTEKVIFADEAQLQKMLYEIFTREAGLPDSGFTDLVGVDAQGNILIVETKLARNTRRVVYHLSAPTIVHDPTRRRFPVPVRVILRIVGANDLLQLSTSHTHCATS
jgi:RecB family endonuclease NucS